jgi:hypothetical protein
MIFIVRDIYSKEGINSNEVNPSKIRRFTPSPLLGTLDRYKTLKLSFDNYDPSTLTIDVYKNRKQYKDYIIPSGVTHAPWDWTGYKDLNKQYDEHMVKRKSVFYHIDPKILGDLRKGKAYLLLDQSHEGYHTDWLFDWFHDACSKYDVDPSRIIYVTGNLAVETQYEEYCKQNNISNKMCVVPHIHFEEFIYDSAQKQKSVLPDVKEHLAYKESKIDFIKTYNCFQKRARPHRIWMFYYLYKNGLLKDGINSMNSFAEHASYYEGHVMDTADYKEIIEHLPMYPRQGLDKSMKQLFEGPMGGKFERDLYHQESRDSWVSVISEASYAENTCFISEKTFKPISTRHPFIMCGNKNSLKYLRELGYKTFEGFVDESYDTMDTWDRYEAIIKNIQTIKNMTNSQKLEWYRSQEDILNHNFETLKDNTTRLLPSSVLKIQEHIGA